MCIYADSNEVLVEAGGSGVSHYAKYTTTVIGAHSVPRWYEAMDRLVSSGQLGPGDFTDAQLRATQAAILEQEIAGIDVITGGEMHRRTHNRHSPPNAMLNHFWQKIPSFQGETKPKPITRHDPNVFHPAAICRGPILNSIDLGLVEEFRTVSSFARKPVKVTMTGPHLLAAVAYDEYYNDTPRMMADFGKLLRQNFQKLTAAGCKHIQIDEPYFTPSGEGEVAAAVEVINGMIEDLPDDVHVGVHICQGNYAVGPDYDGQIGHRYFDAGRYKADLICKIDCDLYLIEHDITALSGFARRHTARRRRRRCASPKRRERPTGCRPDYSTYLAGTRANHHNQFLRLQSFAKTYSAGKTSGDDGSQNHFDRNQLTR